MEWLSTRVCVFSPPPPVPLLPPEKAIRMSEARERSPRHQRPWSVYRANTFDLSSEMIGLALAGENGKGLLVVCWTQTISRKQTI